MYKSITISHFTSWLLSVMNKSIKDQYKPLLNLMGHLCSSKSTSRAIVILNFLDSFTIHQKCCRCKIILPTSIDIMGYYLGPIEEFVELMIHEPTIMI